MNSRTMNICTTTARYHGRATRSTATDSWYFDGTIVLAEATALRLIDGTTIHGEWLLAHLGQNVAAWIDASAGGLPAPRTVPTTSVLVALHD